MRNRGLAWLGAGVAASLIVLEIAGRLFCPLPAADLLALWAADPLPVFSVKDGRARTDPALARLSDPVSDFSVVPSSGVARIVCLGDSTTAGWPYHPNGTYPRLLAAVLSDVLPGRRVETINAGFRGFDSVRVKDVALEAAAFRPEVAILRAGYDDYALFPTRHAWAAARLAGSWRRSLTRRSGLYNLARWAAGAKTRDPAESDGLSVGELDALALDYERNMEETIGALRASGAAVALITTPYARGRPLAPSRAESFRRIDERTRVLAARLGVPLVDAEAAFGQDHFVDGVHVDLEGERLLAVAAARALWKAEMLAPRKSWDWGRLRPVDHYLRAVGADDPAFLADVQARLRPGPALNAD